MFRVLRRAACAVVCIGVMASATALAQEVTFENTVADLSSKDPKVRLRAVEMLKGEGYAEAAVPIAALVIDPVDDVQMAAIAAELNTFLAQRVTPKKRVGFIVEVRGSLNAQQIFEAGPGVLGARRVPLPVAVALANGALDRTFRLALESLYAFGSLAGEVPASDRPAMIQQTAPLLAGLMGAPDPLMRLTALRVVGRVYAHQPNDGPIDERLGDAVISSMNARETPIKETAMWALGAMKYERSIVALRDQLVYYRKGPLAERAFDSMARIAHPASMPEMVERLTGKDATYRLIAIEGLARSGDRTRYDAVSNVVKTQKNDAILLAGHFATVRLADGPVTTIVDSLSRPRLRDQSLIYVQELVPGRVAQFASLLRDANGAVRLDIVDALGLSADAAAVAPLEALTIDKDPAVVLAATRALARLR